MNKSAGEFRIELATASDVPGILELVRGEYGAPYNRKEFWNWRYFENPVANVQMYVARAKSGEIAAMQAVSGYSIHTNGTTRTAHLLTGAMTSSHFRRRGLFRSLVQAIVEDLSNQGASMIFTFPNKLSVHAFRRFPGWNENESLFLYVRPVFGFSGRGNKVPDAPTKRGLRRIGSKLEILSGSEFLVGGDELLNNASQAFSFIDRSKQYLTWRYKHSPGNEYRILHAYNGGEYAGYLIWKTIQFKGLKAGIVVDLVTKSNRVAGELLGAIVNQSKTQGIRMLAFLVGHANPNAEALARNGFIKWPRALLPKQFYLFTYPLRHDGGGSSSTAQDRNWYLTWGDTDVA